MSSDTPLLAWVEHPKPGATYHAVKGYVATIGDTTTCGERRTTGVVLMPTAAKGFGYVPCASCWPEVAT